jgi:hypothetical protein
MPGKAAAARIYMATGLRLSRSVLIGSLDTQTVRVDTAALLTEDARQEAPEPAEDFQGSGVASLRRISPDQSAGTS